MIQTFQPVGQGAFVTEQFEKGQNVVFDCGSGTSTGLVADLIRRTFQEGELIDGVFISSVDREHASGLEVLLNWCRVEKVFLPYLQEEEKALMMLKHLCEGGEMGDFLGRLIVDPIKVLAPFRVLEPKLPVTQVAPETEKEKNVFDATLPMYLMPWKAIDGFRVNVDEDMDWIYQVQVYRQERRIKRLLSRLRAGQVELEQVTTVAAVKRAWANIGMRQKLKEAYAQLTEPFCAVSLMAYGGPQMTDYPLYEQFTEAGKWSYYTRVRSGCVFTGNLQLTEEATREKILQQLKPFMPHIGCLLLPGHGSEYLFHEDLLPTSNAIVVATADNENTTGEPHAKVMKSIMQHQIPFYLVTELPGSTVRFYVSEVEE